MPKLDRIIEDYTASFSINKNAISPMFKLWLTAMPSDAIPATLLQKSVKMVMEPPSGMKANLANSYSRPPVSDEDFFEGSANPAVWKKLCFALCFLHAVLQERRSYGSIGWNIPYSFNDADLRISLSQIKLFVDKGTELRNNEGSVLSKRISTIKRMNEASDVWLENTDLAAKYISFESMQYLIGECNYGGRVTDTHDRRLLNNLVESFINPLVLESTTQLDPESDNYPMPPASDGNAAFYSKFISGLPAAPAPSLMGLNSNCSLVRNEIESSALLLAVSATLPRMVSSSDSGNKNKGSVEEGDNDETTVSADQQRLERICNNVLSRIRKPYDIVAIEEIRPIIGDNSEFSNVVLIQELHRFNRLINKIRSTLYALTLALMGQVVLTAELDSVANDILLSHPPEAWASSSYPTLKPFGGYITDLEARIEVLDKWIEHGPEPVCWLGGLFFPHSFITGVLQNYCRKKAGTGLTIDRLVWSSRVLDQNYPTTKRAEEGWYFGGLYLEACGWDNSTQQLREAKPGVMMEDLPVIHLYPSIIPEEKEEVIGESYTLDKHDDLLVGKNLPLDVKSDDKTEGSDDTINDMENEKIDMKPTLSCHNFAILTRSSVLSDAKNPNVANKVGDLARRESLYVKESHANTLSEKSLAKHVKISGIAPVTVDPKFNSEVDNDQDMYTYECPIYRTNARRGVLATTGHSTNFIMSVKLPIPSFTLESHWVKRGAALLTSQTFK